MIRPPPRSTRVRSSAASDVYKRQTCTLAGACGAAQYGLRGATTAPRRTPGTSPGRVITAADRRQQEVTTRPRGPPGLARRNQAHAGQGRRRPTLSLEADGWVRWLGAVPG